MCEVLQSPQENTVFEDYIYICFPHHKAYKYVRISKVELLLYTVMRTDEDIVNKS